MRTFPKNKERERKNQVCFAIERCEVMEKIKTPFGPFKTFTASEPLKTSLSRKEITEPVLTSIRSYAHTFYFFFIF